MNDNSYDSPVDDLVADRVATITVDGLRFRDLDHDGILAPYEDWRLPTTDRVVDLLGRMTIDEKVGTLLHGTAIAAGEPLGIIGVGSGYDLDLLRPLVHDRGVTSTICRLDLQPAELAEQNNKLQDLAASGRLGIPITVSSDPRHHLSEVLGASVAGAGFTRWPETLGLAAIGDPDLVRRFGDCVRREYRAVGFHMSLAPQADLATSPRWPRIDGSFGEDPALVRVLVAAYVEGVQGGRSGPSPTSVAAVVKHWVGYGASRDGFDGHNHYGRFSAFPSGAFSDHVDAFLDAFEVAVAGVMPTYNILDGLTLDGEPVEPVGAGFNRQLIDGLLRRGHGFDGLVLSDWSITRDLTESARTGEPPQGPADIAMPWGVEELTRTDRYARCIGAGVDQIGGEDDPEPLLEAVQAGLVPVERLDEAAGRVLALKFELGLFDRPFVDPVAAADAVGGAASAEDADLAQRRAITVLTARRSPFLAADDVVLTDGELAVALRSLGVRTTTEPAEATRAVVRVDAPHENLHPTFFIGARQHEGDLDFKPDDPAWSRLSAVPESVPTIVVVHLDRPAILTPLIDRAEAVIGEFGTSPEALTDVLVGRMAAGGRLPFPLPASMNDVQASPCDGPGGPEPLFPRSHGLDLDV